MELIWLSLAALFGSTLAAVTGFGGAAVLLPVLVTYFGVKQAIPVLTVAQLIGNGSRVYFNRYELNYRVVGYFALGAIPMALLGGYLFARAPAPILIRVLGFFLLAIVARRRLGLRLREKKVRRFPIQGFTVIGALFSFLSALMGSVGPFIVPFFLAFGLTKGAFIGTEALATVVMHVFKIIAYQQSAIISDKTVRIGLALGPIMIFGSWLGKRILHRIHEQVFLLLVEAALAIAGLNFLIRG